MEVFNRVCQNGGKFICIKAVKPNGPTYWNLIVHDPDDDKFVDCAIASGSDDLVTSDKHFDILKTTPFPKVAVLSPDEFLKLMVTM